MSVIQLTFDEAKTAVWNRIGDNDSAGHRLSDTINGNLLNRAYCIVKGIRDDRPKLLAANAGGFAFSGGSLIASNAVTTVRHILSAWLADAVTGTDFLSGATELQRWPRHEITRMVVEDATTGQPSAVAFWREGTTTAGSVGLWKCAPWRIPDTNYFVALQAVIDPTPLSAPTDKFDVDPDVSQAIVDMTAAIGARLIGRGADSDEIRRDVPAIFNSAFAQMEGEYFAKTAAPAEASA